MQQTWRDQPLKNSHGANIALSAQLKFYFRFFYVKNSQIGQVFRSQDRPAPDFLLDYPRLRCEGLVDLSPWNPMLKIPGDYLYFKWKSHRYWSEMLNMVYVGLKFKMKVINLSTSRLGQGFKIFSSLGLLISNPRLNSHLKFYQSYRE